MLDIGGGTGALEQIVDSGRYWLIDKCAERIEARSGPRRLKGDAEALPFPDASFDLVISISTLQYVNHAAFFHECARVLRPGGVLAVHENGGRNPVIQLGRFLRKREARHSSELQSYLGTIQDYYVPAAPHPELRCIYAKSHFLLSPVSFAFEVKGHHRLARWAEAMTLPVDRVLIRLPGAKNRAWWNVQHFTKLPAAAKP